MTRRKRRERGAKQTCVICEATIYPGNIDEPRGIFTMHYNVNDPGPELTRVALCGDCALDLFIQINTMGVEHSEKMRKINQEHEENMKALKEEEKQMRKDRGF